jgi:transketolase
VFLGEDGPTHQPVEHLAALRAIPNLWVVRPATPGEVAGAWQLALDRTEGPTALIFSRQGVPVPETDVAPGQVALGAFVVAPGDDAVIVATGSELGVAVMAATALREQGHSIRVVSMPCREAFMEQSAAYRIEVLGSDLPAVSLEAAATFGWGDIIGADGLAIGIDTFGASAPDSDLAEHFGLDADSVATRVAAWLGE